MTRIFSTVILFIVFAPCAVGQTTGAAKTSGPCSPAISGSNNKTTFTCSGLDPKIASQLVELMNRVATNQLDAQAVMSKLDSCVAQIKTVQEQQQPWHLTPSQKANLQFILGPPPPVNPAKVTVDALGGDRNASLIAIDLIEVLKAHGWMTKEAGYANDFTLNPQLAGITIVVTHRDFPQAAILVKALQMAGVTHEVFIDEKKVRLQDDHEIQIAIGSKPTPGSAEAGK